MSPEEEKQLIRAIRANDRGAFSRLTTTYYSRLEALARDFDWPRAVERKDLIQEGLLCLYEIVCEQEGSHSFDPGKGTSLWVFAYSRIRWRMIGFTRKATGISWRVLARRKKVIQVSDVLEKKYGQPPDIFQISDQLDLSPGVVQEVLMINRREASVEDDMELLKEEPEAHYHIPLSFFYQVSLTILKSTSKTQKFIVLLVLKELRSIFLNIVAHYVRDPQASIGIGTAESPSQWTCWHKTHGMPEAIPASWAAVVMLFEHPPPKLHYSSAQSASQDQKAHEKSYEALRKFYSRATKKVSEVGLKAFTQKLEDLRQRNHKWSTDVGVQGDVSL